MKEELPVNFERVMVIDDNYIDLYIASRMITLCNFGKKVLQYSSAVEALKYLQDNKDNIPLLPDVIFVDISMSWMAEFEFLIEYDKLPNTLKNHCKVLILTSWIDERDVTKAEKDKNIVAIKEKPISKEFLNEFKSSHHSSLV